MTDFEQLSCKCGWVGSPRPAVGRWVMPCPACGSIELQLSDLIATNTRLVRSPMRKENAPRDRTLELKGGTLHATSDVGDPGSPSAGRRGDRARPPAPAPAPASHADELDGEISIEALLEP